MKKLAQETASVACYIRVSTNRQDTSVVRQKQMLSGYCDIHQMGDHCYLIDEAASGYKSNRLKFKRLIHLIKKKQITTVLVTALDRLSRNVKHTLEFIELCEKYKVRLVILNMCIDTGTPAGRAFLTIAAAFNQLYRDEISYRAKISRAHIAKQGRFGGGSVPYGYKVGDNGELMPVQREQDIILRIVSSTSSPQRITDQLNDEGIPSKTGGRWSRKVVAAILRRHRVAA